MLRQALVFLVLSAGSVAHAEDCLVGSSEVLKLRDWGVTVTSDSRYDLTISFEYSGQKPLRMVDANLNAFDTLGNGLTGGAIDPDQSLAPGDTGEQTWTFAGDARIARIAREDVVARVCTKAVVYADGSKDSF